MFLQFCALYSQRNFRRLLYINTCVLKVKNMNMYNHLLLKFYALKSTQVSTSEYIRTKTDNQILNAQSVDDLLTVADSKISHIQAASAIITLYEKFSRPNQLMDVFNDPKFQKLCNHINNKVTSFDNKAVILLYRSMLLMGMPSSDHIFQSLQNEILWKLASMDMSDLIKLLNLQINFQVSKFDKQIITELCSQISSQCSKISTVREVLLLVNHLELFPADFRLKLDFRILEMVDTMTPDDFQKILNYFASSQQRPIRTLRAIGNCITHRNITLSVKDIISLLHSLSKLNYYDDVLYEQLSHQLISNIPLIEKSSQIAVITLSLGQLKWRHPELLSVITHWFTDHIELCPLQHLTSIILTCASVNYKPDNFENLLKKVIIKMKEMNIQDNRIFVDIIWSLAILKMLPEELAEKVLKSDFYRSIIGNLSFENNANRLKLLNIQTAAKLEVPGYKGPNITDKIYNPTDAIPVNKNTERLRKNVLTTLSNLIPNEKNLCSSVSTPMGYILDAEFLVTKDIRPLSYANYPIGETLPDGVYRIAVMVWDFDDFTQFTTELIGCNAMAVRHLSELGYHVVQIPYMDYNNLKTVVDKTQYMQKKLKEAIQEKQAIKK